MLVSFAVL